MLTEETIQVEAGPAAPDLADFARQIRREWLITNGLGGYASGTVVGVPTRRYHGWLVAPARPPLERWMLLSSVLERIGVAGHHLEFASYEFPSAFHPRGFEHQVDFAVSNTPPMPQVRFAYEHEGVVFTRRIVLPYGKDEARIIYRLEGPGESELSLELAPFVAMRDFHALTHRFDPGLAIGEIDEHVTIDAAGGGPRLWLHALRLDGGPPVVFNRQPDWWHAFVYREESARGQDDREDLFVPGWFCTSGKGSIELVLRAVADFGDGKTIPVKDLDVPAELPACQPPCPDEASELEPQKTTEERLREAAQAFVVTRRRADGTDSTTILAGYHWFGDWGRDALIALPGLLLETGQFAQARQVLETFASAQEKGLIPNRFSDYGDGCDYNSVDASLWFIHAADAYCDATGDTFAWDTLFGPVCERVVDAYRAGTRFNIHADDDGLVICGDQHTQLTWMDAKHGDVVFTPRHGKPVEINALWYHALCILAARTKLQDPRRGSCYAGLAARVRQAFAETFWNDELRCLYDVVRDGTADASVRPNQIFAVSLANSPLTAKRQQAVLACVRRELLTPYGLRSLSPNDPAYRGRYEGGSFERDGAYHQGTVWGWLIGPYIEAYLRVNKFSAGACASMRKLLAPLIAHLDDAGLGSVSEIFDGDPPHTPRGCIAQAWSVAELLRAWRLAQLANR